MKKPFFALMLATFLLQSCVHIEKRHYRKGFHVEFMHKSKTNDNPIAEDQIVQDKPVTLSSFDMKPEPILDQGIDQPIENETELIKNPIASKPVRVAVNATPKEEHHIEQKIPSTPQKIIPDDKKASKEKGIFMAFGWILCVLGLILLIFASILAGILIMALGGLFFLLAAITKTDKKKTEDQPEYIDVVYLKNGSVIKGMIIEQTINVSLKIQTRDGSIFFYKMEEIEKIAKEKTT